MSKKWLFLTIAVILGISAFFHFISPNIPDLDSFYYIRQAWLYRTEGILDSAFPWLPYSAIGTFSSSLWYGFSILLIPFTYFQNLVLGIKAAGLFLTALLLAAFLVVVSRQGLKLPLLWPFLLFFSAPNVMGQFIMTRPQTVSLILNPLLFSFLIKTSTHRTLGLVIIFLMSFGIAWSHLNFVWVPLLILGITAVLKLIIEKRFILKEIAAVFLGVFLGWLARPSPLGALKLFYIQVVEQTLGKQSGLPLLFGKENFPLSYKILFENFSPFIILWIPAIVLLIMLLRNKNLAFDSEKRIFLWAAAFLSVIFFLLTMFVARRAYNLWAVFGVLLIAGVFTSLSYHLKLKKFVRPAKIAILAVFVFLLSYSSYKTINSLNRSSYEPDKLKEVSLWLKNRSQPGEVVFNLHWSDFSPLFFWNQKNYYIGGLDPIFQYAYNPTLYWKFHYLSADQVTDKTCGAIACTESMLEDTYEVLVNDFNAKYIVAGRNHNPRVYAYLEGDTRFEKKLETAKEAVFLIK